MKTLEILTGILAGAIFLTWLGYLAVRCLGSCRDHKDRIDREIDKEFNRHISPKP